MSEETLCHWIAPQLEPAPLGLLRMMLALLTYLEHLARCSYPTSLVERLSESRLLHAQSVRLRF